LLAASQRFYIAMAKPNKESSDHQLAKRTPANRKAPPSRADDTHGARSRSSNDAKLTRDEPRHAEATGTVKRRKRRRKPVGIGKALRQRGFDEHTIADHYVDVTQRLKGKSDNSGSVEKLLVDVLKECSKYIEPPKGPDRSGDRAGNAPVHVHLVHNVTRPVRGERVIEPPSSIDVEAESLPAADSPGDSESGAIS
jgi:hypothetical protein